MTKIGSTDVVLLAGGFGTRLREVLGSHPKVLALVGGKPFIYHVFDQLVSGTVSRVIVCTGYMADLIEEELGSEYKGLRIEFSREDRPLGTGGALKLVNPRLTTKEILVMNGDTLLEIDLKSFLFWHREHQADISLALTHLKKLTRYGQVETSQDNKITRFMEKEIGTIGSGWASGGTYLMKKILIDKMSSKVPLSLESDVFPKLVEKRMYGYPTAGKFMDIGTPDSLEEARLFFSQIKKLA